MSERTRFLFLLLLLILSLMLLYYTKTQIGNNFVRQLMS